MASGTVEHQVILNDIYERYLILPDRPAVDEFIENLSMLSVSFSLAECEVCYNNFTPIHHRPCCDFRVCSLCLTHYLSEKVQLGIVNIKCLNTCDSYINRDDIMAYLPSALKEKFNMFLVDANKDPCVKTCPNCCSIISIKKSQMKHKKGQKGLKIVCSTCSMAICFPCQVQWHEGITCKQFQKGDKMVKIWAKNYQNDHQLNAQRCPKCKIFIQRSTGCDQMTCMKCDTNFCYLCGDKFRGIKFFGDHFSKLSVFGCKYHFLPQKTITRKLIRGTLFGGKLLASLMLGSLAVGVGGALISLGTAFLPFYGSVWLYRHLKYRKDLNIFTNDNSNSLDDLQCYSARKSNIEFIHDYSSKLNTFSDIQMSNFSNDLSLLEKVSHFGHHTIPSVSHNCESISSNSSYDGESISSVSLTKVETDNTNI